MAPNVVIRIRRLSLLVALALALLWPLPASAGVICQFQCWDWNSTNGCTNWQFCCIDSRTGAFLGCRGVIL
jgi:hypothetical protein